MYSNNVFLVLSSLIFFALIHRQLNGMQVEAAQAKKQQAMMEDRLRQIRLLADIDKGAHDALAEEASNVAGWTSE